MTIRIEFSTDNAAFGEPNSQQWKAEVCHATSNAVDKITNGLTYGRIFDTNGNTVGEFNTLPMEGKEV
jgi:hypothetical protein